MNETEQKPIEDSAPAVVRFTLPPAETIRLACDTLALFPWAEGELAAQVLPAFLVAALGGLKAYNGAPLALHITGGQPAARAALLATVRDMLADSPAVVCVPAGKDSADVAAAARACPKARLLVLEDAAPVKSALRYIVQNAGGVAVLAFSQDTFADDAGLHPDGAIELRLREYIDQTEENTLAEYRDMGAKTLYRFTAARRAADALRAADDMEHGRADLNAAAVYDALTDARRTIEEALTDAPAVVQGTAAALEEAAARAMDSDMLGVSPLNNERRRLQGWFGYEVDPIDVITTLAVCNPCANKISGEKMRKIYAQSMNSARVPHPATRRYAD